MNFSPYRFVERKESDTDKSGREGIREKGKTERLVDGEGLCGQRWIAVNVEANEASKPERTGRILSHASGKERCIENATGLSVLGFGKRVSSKRRESAINLTEKRFDCFTHDRRLRPILLALSLAIGHCHIVYSCSSFSRSFAVKRDGFWPDDSRGFPDA